VAELWAASKHGPASISQTSTVESLDAKFARLEIFEIIPDDEDLFLVCIAEPGKIVPFRQQIEKIAKGSD
jgi:hypothetical protein